MFERLFGKRKEISIKAEDIPEYLEVKFSKQISDYKDRVSSEEKSIKDGLFALLEFFEQLKEEGQAKETKEKYSSVIKYRFIQRSDEIIKETLMCSTGGTYSGFNSFLEKCQETVNEISNISLKEFRHLHAFREKMTKIATQCRLIDTRIKSGKEVSSPLLARIENVKAKSSEIKELSRKYGFIVKDIQESKNKINEINRITTEKEAELLILERSENSRKIVESSEKLREIRREKEIILQKISSDISISRPMRKYVHYLLSSGKKYDSILEDYCRDATNTFVEKDDGCVIEEILNDMLKTNIFDGKEKERVEIAAREMEFLRSLKEKYKYSFIEEGLAVTELEAHMPIKENERKIKYEIDESKKAASSLVTGISKNETELMQINDLIAKIKDDIRLLVVDMEENVTVL